MTVLRPNAEKGSAQEREERQAFLLDLSDRLRTLGDAGAIRRMACELLAANLSTDRVYYVEYREAEDCGVVADDHAAEGLPSLAGTYPLEAFRTTYETVGTGNVWIVDDVRQEQDIAAQERKYYLSRDVMAWINVPLVKDDQLEAILCVVQTSPREWSDEDVQRTAEVAERLWAAVKRAYAENRLRESEARFRHFAQSSSDLLWIFDTEQNRFEFLGPQFEAWFGFPREELFSDPAKFHDHVHEDDRERVRQALPRTLEGEAVVEQYRIVQPDGSLRWLRDSGFPIRSEDGRIRRVGGITRDITDEHGREQALKASEQYSRLLLKELQHRVRNLLGMVRSIVRQSSDRYDTKDEYVAHLLGRLDAMARTQVILSQAVDASVNLDSLLRDELARVADEELMVLEGPEVQLSAKAAEVVTMAVHELATNSIKYGVLGHGGRLAIRWFATDREDGAWLELMWEENGDKPIANGSVKGFGSELIEDRVPYELNGQGSITLTVQGVLAEIAFPLTEGASIFESGAKGKYWP